MHLLSLVLCVMTCVACSAPSTKPGAPTVPFPPGTCSHLGPPPTLPRVAPADLAGPDEGCPGDFEVCLTVAGARAVDEYVRAADAWMAEAVIRCARADDRDAGPVEPSHPP